MSGLKNPKLYHKIQEWNNLVKKDFDSLNNSAGNVEFIKFGEETPPKINITEVGKTTWIARLNNREHVGTINFPSLDLTKPYHVYIESEEAPKLGSSMEVINEYLKKDCFKTKEEAIEFITKSVGIK